jgi:hypothetical protein
MLPWTIPKVLVKSAMTKWDKNPLHDGKRELTGVKKVYFGQKIPLDTIKEASKKLKITINDLMTIALSMAVKRYFVIKGDTKTNRINIIIPVNIRWEPYSTFGSVHIENKFAPMPIDLPLFEDFEKAVPAIVKITKGMKNQFTEVYATYIITLICGALLPGFLMAKMITLLSLPPTLAFSNTPGILRPIRYRECETVNMVTGINAQGKLALNIAFISYSGWFRSSIAADTGVMEDPAPLLDIMEAVIKEIFAKADAIKDES